MKYFILFLLLLFIEPSFSQSHKKFLTSDGTFTTDTNTATSFVIIQNLKDDSSFMVKQYNMADSILSVGCYKDTTLTIPNGMFTYYEITPDVSFSIYHYNTKITDTVHKRPKNYVAMTGYFSNGIKNNTWIRYNIDGSIKELMTYKNHVLDGPCLVYGIHGQYINGKREGAWYDIWGQKDTAQVEYYKSDNVIRSISYTNEKKFQSHIKEGRPDYNINAYLKKKLSEDKFKFNNGNISGGDISFTLTKEGNIVNPSVKDSHNLSFDIEVMKALLNAPKWGPTYIDEDAVDCTVTTSVVAFVNKGKFEINLNIWKPVVKGYNGY